MIQTGNDNSAVQELRRLLAAGELDAAELLLAELSAFLSAAPGADLAAAGTALLPVAAELHLRRHRYEQAAELFIRQLYDVTEPRPKCKGSRAKPGGNKPRKGSQMKLLGKGKR